MSCICLYCPALAAEEARADRRGDAAVARGLELYGWLSLPVPPPHHVVLNHLVVSYKPVVGWVNYSLSSVKLRAACYRCELF